MKLYNICDQADCLRFLMDKVRAELKVEMIMDNFDHTAPFVTQMNPFMGRIHQKFPNPPPKAIKIHFQLFPDPITIYWFDTI